MENGSVTDDKSNDRFESEKKKQMSNIFAPVTQCFFLQNKAGASTRCFSDAFALSTVRSLCSLERDRL